MLNRFMNIGVLAAFLVSSVAMADVGGDKSVVTALAAAIAIAVAALGGALAQARVASSTLEGIARNPSAADRLFVPMILGLSFIESLVILAFLVGLFILGKI